MFCCTGEKRGDVTERRFVRTTTSQIFACSFPLRLSSFPFFTRPVSGSLVGSAASASAVSYLYMALTQSARLHPSWDEEVVPALRKREFPGLLVRSVQSIISYIAIVALQALKMRVGRSPTACRPSPCHPTLMILLSPPLPTPLALIQHRTHTRTTINDRL